MEKHAEALYHLILQTANQFLYNCLHFSIDVLRDETPTYAEVAELMEPLSKIIRALADDFDPMMGQKALEYCALMKEIGIAIANSDEDSLSKHVELLNRKPFL